MEKFIPVEKMNKKQRKSYFSKDRITWDSFSPTTRVVPDKKKYCRSKMKNFDFEF